MNKQNKSKKKQLVPLNDHVFKRMFGDVGCEEQLTTLLNGLTKRTYESAIKTIEIIEKEIPREQYDDKEIRLDVVGITDKGERFNIEAQLRNVDMDSRGLYYVSRQLVQSVKKGQDYNKMNKVIMITIFGSTNKKMDKQEEYYIYEKSNEYTEKYEFIMPKFDSLKNKDLNNPQHRCLMFLSDKTDAKMREKVIKMEPGLEKAQKIMDYINSSPQEIELYENRELTRMDIKNAKERDTQEGIEIGLEKGKKIGLEKGKKIGLEKGKKIGLEKGKEEIAIKLKNKGFSIEDIAEITEQNPKLIEKL